MPIFWFRKAAVLRDEVVPVKGGVREDGTVVKPHYAVRHKRLDDQTADMFAVPAQPVADATPTPVPETRADAGAAPSKDWAAEHLVVIPVGAPKTAEPPPFKFAVGDKIRWTVGKNSVREAVITRLNPKLGNYSVKYTKAPKPLLGGAPLTLDWEVADTATIIEPDSSPKAPEAPPERESIATEQAPAALPAGNRIDYAAPFDEATVPAFGVPAGTSKQERVRLNIEAVHILGRDGPVVDASQRTYSDADKAVLAKYSGTGGIGDSLNEYYTPAPVAAAMWKALLNVMPHAQDVLEPSCGTGVFLSTAPDNTHVTGVELDVISGQIAKILHPDAEIANTAMEAFACEDGNLYDAVIGNPPYGLRGSLIRDDKAAMKTAQTYFLDTAIDKTKGGGWVSLVLPTGVLDSSSGRAFREHILRKAEFMGAYRMPNTAFEAGHTEVTTDVVFFKKRPLDVAMALGVVDQDALKGLGVWDEEYLAGTYFEGRGKEHILGRMEAGWRAKAGMGNDITVEGDMRGVPDEIAGFNPPPSLAPNPSMEAILASAGDDEELRGKIMGATLKSPYHVWKLGDTKVVDGITYVLQGEPPRWHRTAEEKELPAAARGALEASAALDTFLNMPEGDRNKARAAAVAALDAFVAKFGNPHKDKDIRATAEQNPVVYRLLAAVQKDGGYSDAITGKQTETKANDFDSVAARLALANGGFTADQLAAETGGKREEILDRLFASPQYAVEADGAHWATTDNYLSGDLWTKLDGAKAALAHEGLTDLFKQKYKGQVAMLETAIDPKSLEDVEIILSSGFVPLSVVAAFLNSRVDAWKEQNPGSTWEPGRVTVEFADGIYTVTGGLSAQLLNKYLNRTGVKEDEWPKIERMNDSFKKWVLASEYRDAVEEAYNRKYRGFIQRQYSDAKLDIPGINPDRKLNEYHYAGLRWALDSGKGIIAADVGLGKTPRALALAKLLRERGQSKKTLIVVPKSVLANWLAEAETWFPGSSVLCIGETYTKKKDGTLTSKPDSKTVRAEKYHALQQNDYDFVFMSQPTWNELDLNPITKKEYSDQDFWVQRGEQLDSAGDKYRKKIKEGYEQALAQREFEKRTDAIHFDDLGVDCLIMDEAHAYKNLFAARNRFGQQPKFLGGSGLSNRAQDTYFKTKWVRDHNGGNNVYMLTATPTKNSPLEVYSMLSHIAPEQFTDRGIKNSEDFLDRYCDIRNEAYLTTSGEVDTGPVTAGFKNMEEIRAVMRRYIDRKTAEDVGLRLPEKQEAQTLVDMTPEQEAAYIDLRIKAEEAKGKDATGDAHIFSIMDKMGKVALDMDLLGDGGAHISPKMEKAADNVLTHSKDGGQVVFLDSITVHQKFKDMLVKRGFKPDEIAIVNAQVAQTSAQRQNIADKFNSGAIKVVIGNTATMGEGINLQKRTSDIHHLELPWEPASMQQRNGRGLRQGNTNKGVRIHSYLAKGSFDGYRYQTLMAKKDWQDILWNGGDKVENLARQGVNSRDEMLIMLSANPDEARKKYENDKHAAQERKTAQARADVAQTFARYQDMKYSLSKLQDKSTPAAQRLAARTETLKSMLADNPQFLAKQALDMDGPVLVHPQTGVAWHAGTGFELPGGAGGKVYASASDEPTRWVTTRVGVTQGLVEARRYGKYGEQKYTFPIDLLSDAVKQFKFDPHQEGEDFASERAVAGAKSSSSLTDIAALQDVDDAVIDKHKAAFQQTLKQAMLDYKSNNGHTIALVAADGKLSLHPTYLAMKNLDDHDLLLPTGANRKKAIAAWIASERARGLEPEYPATGRHGYRYGSRDHLAPTGYKARYSDAPSIESRGNPWGGVGGVLFGKTFESDARRELLDEVVKNVAAAPTLGDALKEAVPAVSFGESGSKARWPVSLLEDVLARARKDNALDKPLADIMHGVSMLERDYAAFVYGANTTASVHGATLRTLLAGLASQARDKVLEKRITAADKPVAAAA